MKNALKKVIASAMAVASLTIGTAGINVSATDTNALGGTEVAISENSTRCIYYFYLTNSYEYYLVSVTGSANVNYTASVNQGGVTIIVRNSNGYYIESHYISSGYPLTFHINVPANEIYYFYVKSNTASPSYVISGTAYFNWY